MRSTFFSYTFLISMILLVRFCPDSMAQLHPNSILDSPAHSWTLSVAGQYSELMWQNKSIQTFDRQARALVGFSVFSQLKMAALIGYSNFNYRQTEIGDIHFDQDYVWGGNLFLGPFNLRSDKISVTWTLFGEWFNPYKKREAQSPINPEDWNEIQEYISERLTGGMSINFNVTFKNINLFAGPVFSESRLTLKHQSSIGGNDYSYQLKKFSNRYDSNLVIGVLLGVGLRLPGRYYFNVEFRNDNLNEFKMLFSIAQFGSP